jgi:hypothetical protein
MRTLTFHCDKCNACLDDPSAVRVETSFFKEERTAVITYDLCEDCFEKFKEWLKK